MEVRILGPLEVIGDHGPVPLPRGRARALLARLALVAGEVVSAGRLIDDLWGPSPPPTAATALQVLVSKLRRRIEPDPALPTVIVTREPGYVLLLDRDQVDGHRFRALVAGATDLDSGSRAGLLRCEVLVGEGTLRLVGQRVRVEPVPAPVEAWRVTGLVDGALVTTPGDTVHVGRSAQLIQLRQAYQRSVRARRAVLAMVVGEPGIGKSRLAREFARTVAPAARVVTGHCPSYGEGITFRPLREIVQALTPEGGPDRLSDLLTGTADPAGTAAVIAAAIGLTEEPVRPDELLQAVRALFEAVARRQPLEGAGRERHRPAARPVGPGPDDVRRRPGRRGGADPRRGDARAARHAGAARAPASGGGRGSDRFRGT